MKELNNVFYISNTRNDDWSNWFSNSDINQFDTNEHINVWNPPDWYREKYKETPETVYYPGIRTFMPLQSYLYGYRVLCSG